VVLDVARGGRGLGLVDLGCLGLGLLLTRAAADSLGGFGHLALLLLPLLPLASVHGREQLANDVDGDLRAELRLQLGEGRAGLAGRDDLRAELVGHLLDGLGDLTRVEGDLGGLNGGGHGSSFLSGTRCA
jgi:hypothetical protein